MRRMGRPGLLGTMARTAVITGTATAVSGNVARRQQARAAQRQAAQEQQSWEQQQQWATQHATPAVGPTTIDQLKELGALRDQGILTAAEFEAQKAKVLAG